MHIQQTRSLLWNGRQAVWTCFDKNGKRVYAFFNLPDEKKDITISAADADTDSFGTLRDIRTGEKITADKSLTVSFDGRGTRMLVSE